MPNRIEEDHKHFRDVYSGKIRKALKKFVNNGTIFRTRPNGKRVPITIPKMDIPHIVYGDNNKGVGRGQGKDGDILKKGPKQGQGAGQAGQEEGEGVEINLDLEEVLQFMENELRLPPLKPRQNDVLQEEKIKYNSISLLGPESLRHNRRTMMQAMKRQSATGDINKLWTPPGFSVPVKMITPINQDKRYRQYKVIKKPSSNAVVFFARDGSGSMDQYKCDIVSDIAWWIDIWIKRFYERVERCYVWHDTVASEVDENKFYKYRYGGGTICSSALKLISSQLETRFPINKWNFYIFYFTDGENDFNDNSEFVKVIKESFPDNVVNFIGITQIMSAYNNSLKEYVDTNLKGTKNIKTTAVGESNNWYNTLSQEERDKQVKNAILDLLGANNSPSKPFGVGSL
jgi:hypothetical protein